MKNKFKILISFVMVLTVFSSVQLKANEENIVCFWKENESGQLEYVCVDENEVSLCKIGCLPPCKKPGE